MDKLKSLFTRVRKLVFSPKEEWAVIAAEEHTPDQLFKEYLLLLAAIPAVANFLGRWLIGIRIPFGGGVFRFTFFQSLVYALVSYVLIVAGIWAFSQILKFLGPRFGSSDDYGKALKTAVFSTAPYLFAGVFYLIPSLSILTVLVSIYTLYILYTGLPIVMNTPQDKALAYIIVSIVAAILLSIIVSAITIPLTNAFGPDIYPRGF